MTTMQKLAWARFTMLCVLLFIMLPLALTACNPPPTSVKQTAVESQRSQAAREVAREQTWCYECENIKKRRILFGKPGKIGYVLFMNSAGQPIYYLAVDGKCTSSGKRLTQDMGRSRIPYINGNGYFDPGLPANYTDFYETIKGPGEDGAFGSSEDYIYCFSASGQYYQWSGDYLYSDQPFDLRVQPIVIDIKH